MDKRANLILFGGFLGSGKTTLMLALGKELQKQGYNVAIITNDQGELLVDNMAVESKDFASGEVINGCFCCRFGDFVENIEQVLNEVNPDFILAEPVGSCTDLVPTVVLPLTTYYSHLVNTSFYFVLADAPRFSGEYSDVNLDSLLSPRETLVFHQVKEAGMILLSKDDAVSPEDLEKAKKLLKDLNPQVPVKSLSALKGSGIQSLASLIVENKKQYQGKIIDLDYQVYTKAEQELSWYDGHISLEGLTKAPEKLAVALLHELLDAFGSDLVHGKLFLQSPAGSAKISIVSGNIQSEINLDPKVLSENIQLTVNLRAARKPDELKEKFNLLFRAILKEFDLKEKNRKENTLIPGAPKPVHNLRDQAR